MYVLKHEFSLKAASLGAIDSPCAFRTLFKVFKVPKASNNSNLLEKTVENGYYCTPALHSVEGYVRSFIAPVNQGPDSWLEST